MNSLPPGGVAPVSITDMKDPRIRVTFADVAMRVANDGPMYMMILLAAVLAFRGITTGLESIVGGAIALQARSKPPDPDLTSKLRMLGLSAGFFVFCGVWHAAW